MMLSPTKCDGSGRMCPAVTRAYIFIESCAQQRKQLVAQMVAAGLGCSQKFQFRG